MTMEVIERPGIRGDRGTAPALSAMLVDEDRVAVGVDANDVEARLARFGHCR